LLRRCAGAFLCAPHGARVATDDKAQDPENQFAGGLTGGASGAEGRSAAGPRQSRIDLGPSQVDERGRAQTVPRGIKIMAVETLDGEAEAIGALTTPTEEAPADIISNAEATFQKVMSLMFFPHLISAAHQLYLSFGG
jgi:hypothetical protein